MSSPLFTSSPRQQSAGLAIVRVITGIVFVAHGYMKVFGMGVGNVQNFFTQLGAPVPMLTAPFISYLEFLGGFALILGLLTRLVALGLVFDMIGAMMLVHLAKGFFLPQGYEFVLTLCLALLALVVGGGGSFSVDSMLAGRRSSNR
ncbi:MAG: DoxX family protein [bacterium]